MREYYRRRLKLISILGLGLVFVISLFLNVYLVGLSNKIHLNDLKQNLSSYLSNDLRNLSKSMPILETDSFGMLKNDSVVSLAPLLSQFSNVGIVEPSSTYPFVSDSSINFLKKCDPDLKISENLYYASQAKFNGKIVNIFLNSDSFTNSIRVRVNEDENQCKLIYDAYFNLQSDGIYQRVISAPMKVGSYPIHIAATTGRNIFIADKNSNLFVTEINSLGKIVRNYENVLNLSENDIGENGGVKSISINGDVLLMAAVHRKSGCFRFHIYEFSIGSLIEDEKFTFRDLWKMKNCFNQNLGKPDSLNLNGSGGRIHFISESQILFSVGNAENWEGTEKNLSRNDIGRIYQIDVTNGNSQLLSTGHRNPQGICLINGNIFSTEQGPDGGDEVNLINVGNDYGWPRNSYGFPYAYKRGSSFFDANEHSIGTKPLFSWVPSVAVGDIYCEYDRKIDDYSLYIATLKDMSLHKVKVSSDLIVRVDQRIPLGYRLRDILYIENFFVLSTDSKELISLRKHELLID